MKTVLNTTKWIPDPFGTYFALIRTESGVVMIVTDDPRTPPVTQYQEDQIEEDPSLYLD